MILNILGSRHLESLPTYVVEGQKLTKPDVPIPEKKNQRFLEWLIVQVDSNGVEYYDEIDFDTFIATEEWMPTDEYGNVLIILKATFTVSSPVVPFT